MKAQDISWTKGNHVSFKSSAAIQWRGGPHSTRGPWVCHLCSNISNQGTCRFPLVEKGFLLYSPHLKMPNVAWQYQNASYFPLTEDGIFEELTMQNWKQSGFLFPFLCFYWVFVSFFFALPWNESWDFPADAWRSGSCFFHLLFIFF